MGPRCSGPDIGGVQIQLNDAADRLASTVLVLDEDRRDCTDLAGRYKDLSGRMAQEYPSLAGPAAKLGELFTNLDAVLRRLSCRTEELTASAGRLADQVAAMRSEG